MIRTISRAAALAAGYGPDDAPCEPRRSSYTDDHHGHAAYGLAMSRWITYNHLLQREGQCFD